MADQAVKLLSLDLESVAVHTIGAKSVSILNETSSLHSRLVYCDCVLANLDMIASVCASSEIIEVQFLASVFSNQLPPLQQLLKSMAEEVQKMPVSSANVAGRA